MPDARVEDSPANFHRQCDISSWEEADSKYLAAREKRYYHKHKVAIREYFTTDTSPEDIALQFHISKETLLELAKKCLLTHEDGKPWGYRALAPGVTIIDHAPILPQETESEGEVSEVEIREAEAEEEPPPPEDQVQEIAEAEEFEDTAKRQALSDPVPPPVITIEIPETPPPFSSTDLEDKEVSPEQSALPEMLWDEEIIEESPVLEPSWEEKLTEVQEVASGEEDEASQAESPALEEETEIEAIAEQAEETSPLTPPEVIEEISELPTEEYATPFTEEPRDTEASVASEPEEQAEVSTDIVSPETVEVDVQPQEELPTLILPIYVKKHGHISIKKMAQQRRMIHKRLLRDMKDRREKKQFQRIVSLVVLASTLFVIALPLAAGLTAYDAYNNIRGLATDGINHLLNVRALLPVSKSDPMAALNTQNLEQAQVEFKGAQSDFEQLQQLVNRPDVAAAVDQFAPSYNSQLGSTRSLVRVAMDISQMGDELAGIGILAAGIVHGSPLASGSAKPLITVADVENVEGSMVHALYYIDDINYQMSNVRLQDLPVSDKQKAELTTALALLPQARSYIIQAQGLVGTVAWLLGVGQKRRFLVQTMDRAELRPSGGFTGQYGLLEVQDGRMSSFTLRDVALLDYAGNGVELGRQAPPQYSWMNFGNWGLRDSNLSADYPTTALMNMQVFQDEGGGPVDGVIQFTPVLISHILDVTGPIYVAQYKETITAQNLEDRLHYYQQNYTAISQQEQITGDTSHAARKAFTGLLGQLLLDKVRHLPVTQLMNLVKSSVKDIQSRDLEIYFTNPTAETWLTDHGYSGAMDTFTKQDGFMVVQANISISKASQYVHTTLHDDVTLDAQGGATHYVTITLDYQQTGPVYGFDTYADYMRIYAPESAQLLSGDGFVDQSRCLNANGGIVSAYGGSSKDPATQCCTTSTVTPPKSGSTGGTGNTCDVYKTYFPSYDRYCPTGNYSLGDKGFKTTWPVNPIGGPTAYTSDLPGRSMWGGLTVTPKNCISYINMVWYVPHAVQKINGKYVYSLLIGKQGGVVPSVELTIDPGQSPLKGTKPFAFTGDLIADKMYSLK